MEGIGFVCGEISGGLLLFEFEGLAVKNGTFDDFLDLAEEEGFVELIADIREGYEDNSPSGGIHWLILCDDPLTEKLASIQEDGQWVPQIETRGEGAYAICAPTSGKVHPSGRAWKRLKGGLESIAYLNPDEIDALFSLARLFDRKPLPEVKPPSRAATKASGRPGDDFNDRAKWSEILEPHGWQYRYTASDQREHWSRPGRESKGTSATITPNDELLYVFSTSTPFEAHKSYGKFAAHGVLNHTGSDGNVDWAAAARDLAERGYGSAAPSKGEVITVCISDITPEKVDFLWDGRIPRGKLTQMAGEPEQGKTTVTFAIAAQTSTGSKMPMSASKHEPMSVIVMTAEDGLADTVAPRLQAAGADLDHIHAIVARKNADGYEAPLSFPEDIDALREVVNRKKAGLVIIDPLNAFLTGRADSHRDHHVRRALHPLSMLAEETGAAILFVSHLNKSTGGSPLNRVGGSIAFMAAVRTALLVASDPEDEGRSILAVLKSNLARKPPSIAFRLEDVPELGVAKIKWEGFSQLTAAGLLNPPRKERDHSAADEAEEFLEDLLIGGDLLVTEIKAEADKCGISETTLQRAKHSLGVKSKRIGFGKGSKSTWSLPAEETEDGHGST
ncbi:MAG: AAA family ATPase [Acidimicrobiales bacterium]